jgi:hypothetical protein
MSNRRTDELKYGVRSLPLELRTQTTLDITAHNTCQSAPLSQGRGYPDSLLREMKDRRQCSREDCVCAAG